MLDVLHEESQNLVLHFLFKWCCCFVPTQYYVLTGLEGVLLQYHFHRFAKYFSPSPPYCSGFLSFFFWHLSDNQLNIFSVVFRKGYTSLQ